jgi:uncharacterized protein
LALLQDGFIRIAFDLPKNLDEVASLAERYRDRKPDLADLCLIRMSELNEPYLCLRSTKRIAALFAKNGRDVIPIVCPPRG